MEQMEEEKASLENQISRLSSDLEDAATSTHGLVSEHEAKISELRRQLSLLQHSPAAPLSTPQNHAEGPADQEAAGWELEQLKVLSPFRLLRFSS